MPAIPSIDNVSVCGLWDPQSIDTYNRLPVYFQAATAEARKIWGFWENHLGSVPWEPFKGDLMKHILVENAPNLRQFMEPNLISDAALTDISAVKERTATMQLRWQKFISPQFYWLPSFQDFMRGNIQKNTSNLLRQIQIAKDLFYRTAIWNNSPTVWLAGVGPVTAPEGYVKSTANQTGKYDEWVQAQLSSMGAASGGFLTFQELERAFLAFSEDQGATPFDGNAMPGSDSSPLNEKYLLLCSNEDWMNFQNDPWLKENRPLNMNIVTEAYRGDLFGKITCKLERWPIRISADNNFAPTYYAPETVQLNANRNDYNRTIPNPSYVNFATSANVATASQFGVAFLFGGNAYSKASGVNPPSPYSGGKQFSGMDWSGTPQLTDNILIACKDQAGATYYEANSWGEYLRLQAAIAMGIIGDNAFNIMPIIFKRHRGWTTVLPA